MLISFLKEYIEGGFLNIPYLKRKEKFMTYISTDALAEAHFASADPQYADEAIEEEIMREEFIEDIRWKLQEVEPFESYSDYKHALEELKSIKKVIRDNDLECQLEEDLDDYEDMIEIALRDYFRTKETAPVDPDECEKCEEYEEDEEDYIPSATRGDYSPSAPWNAPGMSPRDFY